MAAPAVDLRVGRRARRMPPSLLAGAAMLLAWVAASLLAPWIAPHPPLASDFLALLQPPGPGHPFGTDQIGRDVLSRVLHGGRSVLAVAPAATALGLALGTTIGLAAAYFGGWTDEIAMRLLDAVMALPIVIVAMLALTFLGASTLNVILVIGIVFAPLVARTMRAAALVEVRKDYVRAAELRGEGIAYVMFREVLPNVAGPLAVEATLRLGYAVFTAATLGFLGLGAQPPAPDWGLMVAENQALLTTAPWTVLFPALAIAWVVVGIALVSDGLRVGQGP
ncbi:ABC transporter permease [Arenibaculum pallidiluteum]|uniref:ABC transporter permease n=1 Tax=Arenibaculum pallidiluteum TaxID=2812559 RepID=UPI001A964041|nr:ABC transporter permease [Arenibaculum pallidiluteum]